MCFKSLFFHFSLLSFADQIKILVPLDDPYYTPCYDGCLPDLGYSCLTNWDGKATFKDPLPNGAVLTAIRSEVLGHTGCSAGPWNFTFFLNDQNLGGWSSSNMTFDCYCYDYCEPVPPGVTFNVAGSGWYNFGKKNTLNLSSNCGDCSSCFYAYNLTLIYNTQEGPEKNCCIYESTINKSVYKSICSLSQCPSLIDFELVSSSKVSDCSSCSMQHDCCLYESVQDPSKTKAECEDPGVDKCPSMSGYRNVGDFMTTDCSYCTF